MKLFGNFHNCLLIFGSFSNVEQFCGQFTCFCDIYSGTNLSCVRKNVFFKSGC